MSGCGDLVKEFEQNNERGYNTGTNPSEGVRTTVWRSTGRMVVYMMIKTMISMKIVGKNQNTRVATIIQ
jgi:hypothetical protein